MSETNAASAAPRKRRTRTVKSNKPAYVIVQVLDDHGHPMQFDKKHLKVVSVERSPEKVMEAMEEGAYENAFYLRITIPPGIPSPQRKPELQTAA